MRLPRLIPTALLLLPGSAAAAWQPPGAISPAGTVAAHPAVATYGDDTRIVVYEVAAPDGWHLRAAPRDASGRFAPAFDIDAPTGAPRFPKVVASRPGRIVVVWTIDGAVRATWADAGGPFAPPRTISRDEDVRRPATVAMTASGTTYAAWRGRTAAGDSVRIARLPLDGRGFEAAQSLTPPADVGAPVATSGSDGNVLVSWSRTFDDGSGPASMVRAMLFSDAQRAGPAVVASTRGAIRNSRSVRTRDGRVVTTWLAAGDGGDHAFAQLYEQGGTISPPSDLSGTGNAVAVDLLPAANSDVTVVFLGTDATGLRVVRTSTLSGTPRVWEAPVAITPPSTDVAEFDADIAADSTVAVAMRGRGLNGDAVWVAVRPPRAAWDPAERISLRGGALFDPRLAFTADSRPTVAWQRSAPTARIEISTAGGLPDLGIEPAPVAPLGPPPLPTLIRRPWIIGRARLGSILTCRPGVWIGATELRYEWTRAGVALLDRTRRLNRIRPLDLGRKVRCRITAVGPGGTRVATSKPVTPRR